MKLLKTTTLLLCVTLCGSVQAYDQFRTADGTTCRSSNETRSELEFTSYTDNGGDAGVKATIVIKLGELPKPLNCKRLEDLEVERLKLELETLKQQLKQQNTW